MKGISGKALAVRNEIEGIDQQMADEIFTSGFKDGKYKPLGKFLVRSKDGKYIGIDNGTGHAWTEEFMTIDGCVTWLLGEMPREERKEKSQ